MLGILIIVSIISISIAITSYRYSRIKVDNVIEKMGRPDLIHLKEE